MKGILVFFASKSHLHTDNTSTYDTHAPTHSTHTCISIGIGYDKVLYETLKEIS